MGGFPSVGRESSNAPATRCEKRPRVADSRLNSSRSLALKSRPLAVVLFQKKAGGSGKSESAVLPTSRQRRGDAASHFNCPLSDAAE